MSVRVRLSEVADAAAVTKSVVSRVLNDDPTLAVRAETRERVLAAALRLGYEPHAGARALAGSRTGAIALVAPSIDNPPYIAIARGMYARAAEHGYLAMLVEDRPDHPAGKALVDGRRVDGIIMGSAVPHHDLVERLSRSQLPYVFVNRAVAGSGRNITMAMVRASQLAVAHLTGLGHTRIAHLAGPAEIEQGSDRISAFQQALENRGLPLLTTHHADFTEEAGAAAVPALLQQQPTAVFTASPGQAAGVIRALVGRGIGVPAEVSVLAYGDAPIAPYLLPSLSTVQLPLSQLGAAAVDALLAQIEGASPCDVEIPELPVLLARQSTAMINSDEGV